ncbi:MAG TPA: hypothetical protein VMX38_15425 [Verrucomicrobiae bacterium]|nr:hypothetical protein [Verrucomicrobiae bacterium]
MSTPPVPPASQKPPSETAEPAQAAGASPAVPPKPKGPTINIGEEFGTAKKNLPPAMIVIVGVAVITLVVLIASFMKRAKPQGAGSLDNVAAVGVEGQGTTMVALTFTLHNSSDKILYVHNVQSILQSPKGEQKADAVAAVDFERYYQAFPGLKNGAQPPLSPEDKIQPGESVTRTIIVNFPVTQDVFNQRKSISVLIWPYDQTLPVTLSQ